MAGSHLIQRIADESRFCNSRHGCGQGSNLYRPASRDHYIRFCEYPPSGGLLCGFLPHSPVFAHERNSFSWLRLLSGFLPVFPGLRVIFDHRFHAAVRAAVMPLLAFQFFSPSAVRTRRRSFLPYAFRTSYSSTGRRAYLSPGMCGSRMLDRSGGSDSKQHNIS